MPLHKIERIFSLAESEETFLIRIERIYSPFSLEYQFILRAYTDAQNAFRDKHRDDGDPYFTHVRAVAIVLIDYLYIFDRKDVTMPAYEIIVAALLHDVVEDSEEWDVERVNRDYSRNVALLLDGVSKKPKASFDSEEAQLTFYHDRLAFAILEVMLIKLSDRLHNQLTLWSCDVEKIKRKMIETDQIYIPLAKKWGILVHELEATVIGFEERLQSHMKSCKMSQK